MAQVLEEAKDARIDRIDFSAKDVARRLDDACRDHGFVALENPPGLSKALVEEAFAGAKELFAQDSATKATMKRIDPVTNRGYTPFRSEKLQNDGASDALEAFSVKLPLDSNDWTGCPPRFRRAAERALEASKVAIREYAIKCAAALGLPETYFSDKLNVGDLCTLRFMHYPPTTDFVRAGAHTDFGLFTFVFVDDHDVSKGLQLKPQQSRHWADVDGSAKEGGHACVVNTGALAARWTNDRWRATLHRVVAPDAEAARGHRYSIIVFADPDADTLVTVHPKFVSPDNPCKYPPITSRDYVHAKLSAMMQRAPHDTAIDDTLL